MASEESVAVDSSALESVLALLQKFNVKMFRHKTEVDYIEVVMGDSGSDEEEDEEETMEEKDISLYSNSSIGISKKSFDDDDQEQDYFSIRRAARSPARSK